MGKTQMEEFKEVILRDLTLSPKRLEVKVHTNCSFSDSNKDSMLTALCHAWLAFFNEYYTTFLGFKTIRIVQKKHTPMVHDLFSKGDSLFWNKNELQFLDELIQGVSIPCFKGTERKINLDPKRVRILLSYLSEVKTDDTVSINDYLIEQQISIIYDYKSSVFSSLLEDGYVNIFLGYDEDSDKKVFYSSFFIMYEQDVNIIIDFFSAAMSMFLPNLKQGEDYSLIFRLIK